ncbi:MAG: hypothetical protein IKE29_21610 [Paenibacillus sp.]|uniref:hypothetical protein n=1 Tax=Paenibacillus sp. TaxID=58172 RepID=UPI0025D4E209|nr:hypothetical protein [Paenibacillus sp.]MBR2567188.1 hypothetical protein [Paenibacillus sp.]
MAELIIGLSQSNNEMKTTLRYLDQIQRSTERLGRVRYQGLIKVNNELRTTARRLENIYSTAIRLSRLRITPKIGLDDQLSPALDRALTKLNSFRNQMVKASGTVSVEVKQKVEVAMGKIVQPSASSMSVVIGSNNTTINNVAKEDEGWMKWVDLGFDVLDAANNVTDLFEKRKKVKEWWSGRKDKKNKAANPSASTEVAEGKRSNIQTHENSDGDGENKRNKPSRFFRVPGRRGRRNTFRRSSTASTPVSAPTPKAKEIITDFSDAEEKKLKMDFDQKIKRSNFGFASASPMGMSNLFSGDGMMGKIGSGFSKGAKRLLGPVSMLADVASIANAPAEERGRAVGSMIGGSAGTAIGSTIGSFILPGIGTYIGGAVGGWAGSEVGGWIGDKAKDIGNFVSNASEGLGNALSGAADYVSEKTKKITGGIANFFGFGSKKEEQTTPAATVASSPSVPEAPQMPPPYKPEILSMTRPKAYMNNPFGSLPGAGLIGISVMQAQAMSLNNGGQPDSKSLTVHISEEQMSSLGGYLKDFKTETTNQIAVHIAPGTVQVTVQENAIDYDAVSHQVGQRITNELRLAMQNRKTIMA